MLHLDKIQEFVSTQKAEILSSLGMLIGSVTLIDKISPYLQFILLILSVTSLGISLYFKIDQIIKKRNKKK